MKDLPLGVKGLIRNVAVRIWQLVERFCQDLSPGHFPQQTALKYKIYVTTLPYSKVYGEDTFTAICRK